MAAVRNLGFLRLVMSIALSAVGASCVTRANKNAFEAPYVGFDTRQFSSTPISTSLSGGKVGWEARKVDSKVGGFLEAGYLRAGSGEFDVMSFGGGGTLAAYARGPLELGALGLVEVQHADLDEHQNVNVLVAFGAGGYVDVRIGRRCSLTFTLSGHAFVDVTPPTRCNDGSSSQSTGQGTCSHHGGIDFYTDELGEGAALDAVVAFRVWFGADRNRSAADAQR